MGIGLDLRRLGELVETARGIRVQLTQQGTNPCDAEGWVRTKAGWAGRR